MPWRATLPPTFVRRAAGRRGARRQLALQRLGRRGRRPVRPLGEGTMPLRAACWIRSASAASDAAPFVMEGGAVHSDGEGHAARHRGLPSECRAQSAPHEGRDRRDAVPHARCRKRSCGCLAASTATRRTSTSTTSAPLCGRVRSCRVDGRSHRPAVCLLAGLPALSGGRNGRARPPHPRA